MFQDPIWYFNNQNTSFKILSNIIFLIVGIYGLSVNEYIIGMSFIFLFIVSSLFHVITNKHSLFIDRISMVFVICSIIDCDPTMLFFGIFSVCYWYLTDDLILYLLYHLLTIYTYTINGNPYVSIMYIFINLSQLIEKGKYHGWKHILLGLTSSYVLYLKKIKDI